MAKKRSEALIKLSHDHHHGLVFSHRLQKQLKSSHLADADPSSMAASIVDFYAQHLVPHFKAEEQAVFPFMQEHLGEIAVVRELLEEHRLMNVLVEECRVKRSAVKKDTFLRFAQTLEGHIRKEERVLFEIFEEKIPEEVATSLLEELRRMGHA